MLIKNIKDSNFIRCYNSLLNPKSKFFLTEEELYVYSLLFVNRMEDGSMKVNTSLLCSLSPIKFFEHESKNRKHMLKTVFKLINKQVISLNNDIELDDISYNDLLEMSINDFDLMNDGLEDDSKAIPTTKFKNFAKVQYIKFYEMKSIRDYYIFCITSKWNNGFKCSYKRWGEILGINNHSHIVAVINDAVERGIIHKKIGQYIGKNNQDVNTYYVYSVSESESHHDQPEFIETKNEDKSDIVTCHDETITHNDIPKVVVKNKTEHRQHNWDDYKFKLTVDDFLVLLTTGDEDLIKRANRRIDRVSAKSDGGKTAMRKLRECAQSIIDKEASKAREEEQKKSDEALKNKFKPLIEQTNSMYVVFHDGTHKQYQDYQWDVKPYMFVAKYIDEYSNLKITCVKWENLFNGKLDVEEMYEEHLEAIKWAREHHVV